MSKEKDPAALVAVERAAASLERAQERLVAAIREARDAGLSLRMIGCAAGVSSEKIRVLAGESSSWGKNRLDHRGEAAVGVDR